MLQYKWPLCGCDINRSLPSIISNNNLISIIGPKAVAKYVWRQSKITVVFTLTPNLFYIDGGTTLQRFLREYLIDEMIIALIPLLLGGGDRRFEGFDQYLGFKLADTMVLLTQLVKGD